MSDDFEFRYYKPGDEHEIVEVMKASFPFWEELKSPVEYWKWKYGDSPHPSYVSVSIKKGRIVGVSQSMTQRVKIGNTYYLGAFGSEIATHPDFRGTGMWDGRRTLMRKYREENNLKFTYSNSENPIVIKRSLKRKNSIFPHQMTQMTRMRDTSQIESKTKQYGFNLLKLINKTSHVFPESNTEKAIQIVEIDKFNEEFDQFHQKIRPFYDWIVEKNVKYLNWRYCDPRGGKYIIKKAVQDKEVVGYTIVELSKKQDQERGSIVELIASPEREEVAAALLFNACNQLDDHGINSINYGVVKGHPYQKISSKLGFIDTSLISKMYTFCNFELIESEYYALKSSPKKKIYLNYGDVFLH